MFAEVHGFARSRRLKQDTLLDIQGLLQALHKARFSNKDIINIKMPRLDILSVRGAFFVAFDSVLLTYGGFVVKYAVH